MLNRDSSPEKFVEIVENRKARENGRKWARNAERAGLVKANPARSVCN
jgi:hypothetical protein